MRDLAALTLELRPSPILLVCGGGAHLLAGAAVAVCSLSPWIKAGLIVGIALALIRFGWQYGYRRGRGFIARIERLDGVWQLETGDGSLYRARLTGGYAHPGLVLLNFRLERGGWRSLALLPDAVEAEALRRLRVWLRTQRDEDEAERP
jgi:toxin CptA